MQRLPDSVMAGLSAGGESPCCTTTPGATHPADSEGSSFAELMPQQVKRQVSDNGAGKEPSADLPKEPGTSSPDGKQLPGNGTRLPESEAVAVSEDPASVGAGADGQLPVLDDRVTPVAFYAAGVVGDMTLRGTERATAAHGAGSAATTISGQAPGLQNPGVESTRLVELSLPADAVARIDSRFNRYQTSAAAAHGLTQGQGSKANDSVLPAAAGGVPVTAATGTPATSVATGAAAMLNAANPPTAAARTENADGRSRQRLSLAHAATSRPITVSGPQSHAAADDVSEFTSVALLPARRVAGGHHLPYLDQPLAERSPRGAAGRDLAAVPTLRAENLLLGADRVTMTASTVEPMLEAGPKLATGTTGTATSLPTIVTTGAIVTPAPPTGTSAPATPVPAFSIDVPVLNPAWQTALNERVVWMAARNVQTAELRLTPAELGPLTVQVSVDDKSVSLSVSAAHAVTREVLEAALPKLKDMLADNGMNLADANLTGGSSGEADAEAQSESGDALLELQEEIVDAAAPSRSRRPAGAVDLFA